MTDLRHAAIDEWEAVYLINAKIVHTIRYPLQVAVMPRSVLKACDDKHVHSSLDGANPTIKSNLFYVVSGWRN